MTVTVLDCDVPGTAVSEGSGMCGLFLDSDLVTAFTDSVGELIVILKFEITEFENSTDFDKFKVGCDLVFKILQTNWPLDLLVPFWYVFSLLNCSFVISLERVVCSINCLLEQCVGSIYGWKECTECSNCCLLEQLLCSTEFLLERSFCSMHAGIFEFELIWRPFVWEYFVF